MRNLCLISFLTLSDHYFKNPRNIQKNPGKDPKQKLGIFRTFGTWILYFIESVSFNNLKAAQLARTGKSTRFRRFRSRFECFFEDLPFKICI